MLNIKYSGESNVGKKRANNEDNFSLNGKIRSDVSENICRHSGSTSASKAIFAVCDGMGGDSFGEKASLAAVKELYAAKADEIREAARCSVHNANLNICDSIRESGKQSGTTLAALYIADNTAVCCNIGDSRVYLYRDEALKRLSVDHSKAQSMINMGVVSEEEARNVKGGHELTQHLGIFEDDMIIEPHFSEQIPLAEGDIFLLCSDGLTDMLTDDEIKELIAQNGDSTEICDRLINAALDKGGEDNVTVIILCVEKRSSFFGRLFS